MNQFQNNSKRNKTQAFVVLAKISRELFLATKTAQEVSLIAKNARALTVRAGDKVLGFKAITNFIDDLATTTIQLATTINRQALEVATLAAELQRKLYGLKQFDRVLNDEKAVYRESCRGPRQILQREVEDNQREQKMQLNRLISNLSDIQQEIRSAGIIALNAKVESAKSPEYQASLDVIADDILHSTNQIKTRIDRSQSIIKMI
ncbi:MAG: hypothetical protein GY829_06905 [Gammaproteobacteria bacterium]|nr:hypothetical protein [Gammaproteobacteria bacterium]